MKTTTVVIHFLSIDAGSARLLPGVVHAEPRGTISVEMPNYSSQGQSTDSQAPVMRFEPMLNAVRPGKISKPDCRRHQRHEVKDKVIGEKLHIDQRARQGSVVSPQTPPLERGTSTVEGFASPGSQERLPFHSEKGALDV
jgi:hypothetical protein